MHEPYVFQREDGSFLIEFSEENSKFAMYIEKDDLRESSWFYVNKNYEMKSGDFSEEMIECLKKFFEENNI